MNKFEFKNLTPFKWFVLENFPFIEADFDALTEWQLFCKIGKEINKIINSQNIVGTEMETLSQAFIELKNYVNNYFDNLDVQEEINNKLNEMALNGTLENLINERILGNIKENVKNIYNNNSFKPTVYASMYMLDHTTEVIKQRILRWKEMGCKGIIVLINFNNDSELTLLDDLEKTLELMNYAKNNGLIVDTIKFHSTINSRISTDILTKYYNQVNYVLTSLDAYNFGIRRITIFNELPNVYGNSSDTIKNQAIEIIENLKNLGYTVGITTSNLERGIGYMINYSPSICNVVDFFAFNYYQVFPFKKELTTKEDSIFAWEKSLDALYKYKTMYNKNIILSETGCLNNWLNMMNPSDYTLNQYPANGKTYPLYFYGLFKNEVANTNLNEVWLWYDEVLTNYDDVIEFFKFHLGGDLHE